jgi:hypothetical protein
MGIAAPVTLLERAATPIGCSVPKMTGVAAGIIVPAVTAPAASVIVLALIAPTVAFRGTPGAATRIPTETPDTLLSVMVAVPIGTEPVVVGAMILVHIEPPAVASDEDTGAPNDNCAAAGRVPDTA